VKGRRGKAVFFALTGPSVVVPAGGRRTASWAPAEQSVAARLPHTRAFP
jgi:hypothetical protein